jgi:hypothetical protein
VCSKDEHASIGVAENKKDSNAVFENSIGKKEIALESFAKKKKQHWSPSHIRLASSSNDARRQHSEAILAIGCLTCRLSQQHRVSFTGCHRTKTIFQVHFNRRAHVRRIPPIGAFCAVYTDRRQLQDQSFGLTSKQGVFAFIGIARYK